MSTTQLTKTHPWPNEATRVNIHDAHELDFWARRFRVAKEMLIRAVAKVGPRFPDVEQFLDAKRAVPLGD